MDLRPVASRRTAAAVAAVVVAAFGCYFVVAALVPDLFGTWPRLGVAAVVAVAACCFAVSFAARSLGDGPFPWRLADAAVAAISALLLVQAITFAVGTPLSLTADGIVLAFVHLVLWTAALSTVLLVGTALRSVGDDLPEPSM
ncbi:hypothetical protein MBEHAL_0368 [Halarchaeum acidiphilum MH1-52-1]|uniref:Uncharacterized protein n=2 Tax=Halarchaeum acidiphilum TaxID=489138 RepID=U3AA18_9EURY|nr:hypothetical protein [Halarchaeum acidiphilum]GAD51608.1 hypothetical protein MBEHAL_0368 [Halarchaeum acidiphilum MH1-52-1]